MQVLGLIPARGGSKGVPRKNVRDLAGKPLIAYSIEAAHRSKHISRVVVSTEDEEVANVATKWGAEVPFRRPTELAGDEVPTLPVVLHALQELGRPGWRPDAVCLLQPTSPLRPDDEIDGCIELFVETSADCVISVQQVPDELNPHWTYLMRTDGFLELATGGLEPVARRQELPPAYYRSGSVYVCRTQVLEQGSLYGRRVAGYVSPAKAGGNIDTPEDWDRMAARLEKS